MKHGGKMDYMAMAKKMSKKKGKKGKKKYANMRARLVAMMAKAKKGAKPAMESAKGTAKATMDSPKMKELMEYIKKNKKGLATAGGGGALLGMGMSSGKKGE